MTMGRGGGKEADVKEEEVGEIGDGMEEKEGEAQGKQRK